jgi:hypothetical protein
MGLSHSKLSEYRQNKKIFEMQAQVKGEKKLSDYDIQILNSTLQVIEELN